MPGDVLRVALTATPRSVHTIRWANQLAAAGVDVHLVTLESCNRPDLEAAVTVHEVRTGEQLHYIREYLRWVPALCGTLREIKPDLVNSHYANTYGVAGVVAARALRLPHLLSVWGSDVYEFPRRSSMHRRLLRAVLRGSTMIASTSHAMARETATLTRRPIVVTPFGIDVERFSPVATQPHDVVRFGTVKGLDHKYGIDILLEAFARLAEANPGRVSLSITGTGSDASRIHALATRLGLAHALRGEVDHIDVPRKLAELDVFVALSREESFGVAILEAGAVGLPSIVSDAPGPLEVSVPDSTALVVPREDVEAAADAMQALLDDPERRARMGDAARQHVLAHYSTDEATRCMIEAYNRTIR